MITPTYDGPNLATVPPACPIPWGWQAAPADTLLRVLERAGFGDAERVHPGQVAAAFRIRRGAATFFVTWVYGGGFSLCALEADLPTKLVDAIVDFVNGKEGEAIDPRPGFYYVSALDGDRKTFARGPFLTHREALDAVAPARELCERHDPRAHWYAWGTARSETDAGPGVLDRWDAARREVIDDRDVGREEGEDNARDFG